MVEETVEETPTTHVLKEMVKNLRHDLTPEEWERYAMRHAEIAEDMRALDDQKKQMTSELKAREKALEAELAVIGNKVRERCEYRSTPCREEARFSAGVAVTVRLDTGEDIGSRPLLDSERQLELVPKEEGRKCADCGVTDTALAIDSEDALFCYNCAPGLFGGEEPEEPEDPGPSPVDVDDGMPF